MRQLIWSLAVAACTVSVLAADSKPNIVFIMADDLGWADVGFHGGNAPTPNLDRLAVGGLELTQHYVAPLCSPTRAGLITGRYWSRFGVTSATNNRVLPQDTVTLPRALHKIGYENCLAGKWHLGSLPDWGPNRFGFDHSYGSLAGGVGPWKHRYKVGPYSVTWHRNQRLMKEPGHVTDLITQEATDWIAKRSNQPFFLYVPFTAVHLPVKEPGEWLARVPANIPAGVPRQYAACIMHLDDAVGKILSALDTHGKRSSTLVIFTSDNGGSTAENNDTRYPDDVYPAGQLTGSNTPLRGKKGTLYEGGIRVPAIASWPGKLDPGKCKTPIHITDWMPTFCHFVGYHSDSDLKWDGTDVWPYLTGDTTRRTHPLYWAGPGYKSLAIRDGDWKLIVHQRDSGVKLELFHLADDPRETNNLAEQMPERVAKLQRLLAAASRADGDAVVER